MAKAKTVYVCTDCGNDHPRWQGQCSSCKAWNTLKEMSISGDSSSGGRGPRNNRAGFAGGTGQGVSKPKRLKEINIENAPRYDTGLKELNRVMGSEMGVVVGSVNLIGGEPGAGKSTLLMQVMGHLSKTVPVLYITGEESLDQVAMRAERLGVKDNENLHLLSETEVDTICNVARQYEAKVMVVDSIQTTYLSDVPSAPGNVSQVRESAATLNRFCKENGITCWLVGHVSKEGSVAGPKVLEHIVDSVLMLEGDADGRYRMLRASKQRFGNLDSSFFAMTETGLKEVKNPSAIFLQRLPEPTSGSLVTLLWEGTRPLLVEIQALVEDTSLGNPRRVAVGVDQNRIAMLLAVTSKHTGTFMADQDVFVNLVGGLKTKETATDLALVLAMLSSFQNKPLSHEVAAFGEVGLSGEIRPVSNGLERIKEAAKHGFKNIIVPKANKPKAPLSGINVIPVDRLQAALDAMSGIDA